MQENTFKNKKFNLFKITNYWRNLDKQILLSFITLFILGLFFSFSSTSFIADERLNKNYYFFFQKHFLYTLLSFSIMIAISLSDTSLLRRITGYNPRTKYQKGIKKFLNWYLNYYN